MSSAAYRPKKLYTALDLCQCIDWISCPIPRLLDCAFVLGPRPEPDQFAYGKFEPEPPNTTNEGRAQFLSGHIEMAVHFDLALATHPTKYEKYAHYPAKIFEQYAQKLGLKNDDDLLFYGRGPQGMMFASRAYWMFKSYGFDYEHLLLLDGGFDAWVASKYPAEVGESWWDRELARVKENPTKDFAKVEGKWQAKTEPTERMISFEQLQEGNFGSNFTLIDSRPRAQFEGRESGFDPSKPKPSGSHLPGAINVPAQELIQPDTGRLKSPTELRALLEKSGLVDIEGKNLVSLCNSGFQASLLATAMDVQLGPEYTKNLRVYTGSMLEVQTRAPELISEGGGGDGEAK